MKCKAIVSITIEVEVVSMQACWTLNEVSREARTHALRRVQEICEPLGKISVAKVTAIVTEED